MAWVRKWLMMNINEAALIDGQRLLVRCKEVYVDSGECLLVQRKGVYFATYDMDLVVKWYAQQKLGDRVLGEARGRVRIGNFSSVRAEGDENEEAYEVEGHWQFKRPLGQGLAGEALEKSLKTTQDDACSDCERLLLASVKDKALNPLKKRLGKLKDDLAFLAEKRNNAEPLPEPSALNEVEYGHLAATKAELETQQLLQNMKAKMRPETYEARLEAMKQGKADFRCMCLTDPDVITIVDGLTEKTTTLDLSYNDLTDAGLQPLLFALATSKAPNLTSLNLDNTQISDIGRRQFDALKILRKHLQISFDANSAATLLKQQQDKKLIAE